MLSQALPRQYWLRFVGCPTGETILERKKTWEMRGSRTSVRETIGFVAGGSGTVIGVCDVIESR
jgi:hypothetical protein